ncbi:MAG: enoyl-ACP reductase [Armatimonadota bacterium]|nr:enoyl-ACP reductase [Armatimonadota bacterium]MDR5697980.1 enoyl-ACP reductase [Armatimonadota bacterium]
MGLLSGRNALVMGVANRWSIAWGITQAFLREGARFVFTCEERNEDTVRKLVADLSDAVVIRCDVTQDQDLERLREELRRSVERVDVLVHSIAFAKTEDLRGRFVDTSRDGYLLAHNVSAYSLVAAARTVEPLMPRGGAIVTLTFAASGRVFPNYNVMATAKAALETSVRYLAYELGEKGIRVNAISAGPIKTASARAVAGLSGFIEAYAQRAPLRRTVDQEEVGDAAVLLCSDLARGVTGQVLFVDAGYHVMGI